MADEEKQSKKITDIVGNLVKADQRLQSAAPKSRTALLDDEDIIILNVGGVRHETRIATLMKKPETRLYAVGEAAKASGRKEFYFDRNPQIFPCILNYYRIGKLHMPTDVCGPAAKAELDYWELEDKDIEECCWVNYISYEETMDMLEKFRQDERDKFHSVYVSPDASFFAKTKPRLWRALQDPYSSRPALSFAVLSLFIVLVSITVFVIETLPYFGSVFVHASDSSLNITSEDLRREMDILTDVTPNDILLIIDNACNIFFFIEFVIKLIASPDKRKFFKSPLVVTELLCLVPYYIGIFIVMVHPDPIKVFLFIRILFATRVLRIFRIFVLMKHFLALKILIYTIRASTKELILLLIVLLIGIVIFACMEYYMEILSNQTTEFVHIPYAFWWAVITMTTVGYGDVHPSTGLGYAIGALCAISGVLVIALSVPVIVNNFTVYYTHAQSREKLKQRRKKFEQTEKWHRLKAGLKSKLKSGALNGMLNGIKNRNNVNPNNNSQTKMSFLKAGIMSKPKKSTSDSEEDRSDKSMPHTARDVVLEDVSETVIEDEPSAVSDKITVIETHVVNGTISHAEEKQKNGLNVGKQNNLRKQARLGIFGGSFKAPRIFSRTRNQTDTHDLKHLNPASSRESTT